MTGRGADYCFECVGLASVVQEAYACYDYNSYDSFYLNFCAIIILWLLCFCVQLSDRFVILILEKYNTRSSLPQT
ncbi:LOW QUALITY PROTEIN: NAD(P)-binding domain containing protein [Trema orientale]|uniref:NAD(P)-binding domain containing protein n=1 Tax=Trema orientale TaxID=63057 RepID=A0A2P5EY13_TREOI|nr:LOW QUALITY PROTEIN: NAD(P)-binding domain containing protein [Trema orientale]